MTIAARSLSALAFAGAALNPAVLVYDRPVDTAPRPALESPIMAAAGAAGASWTNTAKDSVYRIGVELTGVLYMPDPILNDAGEFVPGSETIGIPVVTYRLGTGFAVDPSGYFVTNAHVVETSEDTVLDELWSEFVYQTPYELASYYPELSEDDVYSMTWLFMDYVERHGYWDDLKHSVVVLDPAKADVLDDFEEMSEAGWVAEVKKEGTPYPGKDIAVIKVDADEAFAPLTLAAQGEVETGSNVYVIGYPGDADLNERSFLVPTVTSGIVSAVKPSDDDNYSVIQVQAAVNSGNSGGPTFNDRGEVIGIATLSAVDSEAYNWVLPVELAKEYLRELNVATVGPSSAWSFSFAGLLGAIPAWVWMAAVGVLFAIVIGLVVYIMRRHRASMLAHHLASPAPSMPSIPSIPTVAHH